MKLMLLVLAVILLLVRVTQGKQDLSQGAGGHVQGIPGALAAWARRTAGSTEAFG